MKFFKKIRVLFNSRLRIVPKLSIELSQPTSAIESTNLSVHRGKSAHCCLFIHYFNGIASTHHFYNMKDHKIAMRDFKILHEIITANV